VTPRPAGRPRRGLGLWLAPRRGEPGDPALAPPPHRDDVRALIARGSGRNHAATDPAAGDPRLRPRRVPYPPGQALELVRRAVASLPRWRLRAGGPVLWAERRSRLFRFVDDVYLLLESDGEGGTIVHAWSGSRLGRGDLGQNRRNLGRLWRALGV
jgi:uncharacterized protein (DUF1499 family)